MSGEGVVDRVRCFDRSGKRIYNIGQLISSMIVSDRIDDFPRVLISHVDPSKPVLLGNGNRILHLNLEMLIKKIVL